MPEVMTDCAKATTAFAVPTLHLLGGLDDLKSNLKYSMIPLFMLLLSLLSPGILPALQPGAFTGNANCSAV